MTRKRSAGVTHTNDKRPHATQAYLASSLVNIVDGLDGVQVVDTGVEADLVHHDDTGSLYLRLELLHGVRDVRGGDDVLLGLDRGLDDSGVEGVWNQGDDNVVLADSVEERIGIGYIQREGGNVAWERRRKSLRVLEVR